MSRRARNAIVIAAFAMLLAIGVTPFALMLLDDPKPIAAASPGAAGNGVYVGDSRGYAKLFPSARVGDRFPDDAFAIGPEAAVFVKARQFDYLSAYAVYSFPSGDPVAVTATVTNGILAVRPRSPLAAGRYIVKVSRDDAWGGSDYFFLRVRG